jgi:hypothetical protein
VQLYLSQTVFGSLMSGKPGGAQTHSRPAKSLLGDELWMLHHARLITCNVFMYGGVSKGL